MVQMKIVFTAIILRNLIVVEKSGVHASNVVVGHIIFVLGLKAMNGKLTVVTFVLLASAMYCVCAS